MFGGKQNKGLPFNVINNGRWTGIDRIADVVETTYKTLLQDSLNKYQPQQGRAIPQTDLNTMKERTKQDILKELPDIIKKYEIDPNPTKWKGIEESGIDVIGTFYRTNISKDNAFDVVIDTVQRQVNSVKLNIQSTIDEVYNAYNG